jgi:hypothetical protein
MGDNLEHTLRSAVASLNLSKLAGDLHALDRFPVVAWSSKRSIYRCLVVTLSRNGKLVHTPDSLLLQWKLDTETMSSIGKNIDCCNTGCCRRGLPCGAADRLETPRYCPAGLFLTVCVGGRKYSGAEAAVIISSNVPTCRS